MQYGLAVKLHSTFFVNFHHIEPYPIFSGSPNAPIVLSGLPHLLSLLKPAFVYYFVLPPYT